MAQKKAVPPKKKAARQRIELEVNLGQLPATKAQVAILKKALKNQVLAWMATDAPGQAAPVIMCEEFRRPPKGSCP